MGGLINLRGEQVLTRRLSDILELFTGHKKEEGETLVANCGGTNESVQLGG